MPAAQRNEIELEIVRTPKRQPAWRPVFLTARRFLRICHAIERGANASEACRRELVTYRLFRMHVQRSPRYARRLREAEELREHFLREFHIANIKRHAKKTVVASMFWLERRYPNEFALRTVNRQINSEELVLDKVTPEQLIEDIQLARQVAEERPLLTD